ncbi:hypothetical protein DYU11_19295 [Fibrisoma montanum]|uniref:Uncharacterized protein n=1 Tax=Fibrisoma montanum TaxID=2305895 RepID=A0A418M6I4_9BACT|nr:hypothetical protein [Fibrisoma montanum]RIV21548.1 hypothetical protein DYU11_19295 [Fibrisoma montanum]
MKTNSPPPTTRPKNRSEAETDAGTLALTTLEGGLLTSDDEPAGTDQNPDEVNPQTTSDLTGTDRDQTGENETMATES